MSHVSFVPHPIWAEQCVYRETHQAQPLIPVNSGLRVGLLSIRHLGRVGMRLAPGTAQVRRRCNESRRLMTFVSRQASHSGFWTGFERSKASCDPLGLVANYRPSGGSGLSGNLWENQKGGPVGSLRLLFNPIGLSEPIPQNGTRRLVC